MKVLKFGGTSVGSAQRIKNLASLINDQEQKIVVLSAMSGTTNSLVEIINCLYDNQSDKAGQLIEALVEKYKKVVDELFVSPKFKQIGLEIIKEHFGTLWNVAASEISANKEKTVLAQGELMSTAFLHHYLQEQNIPSVLLPALSFMRIDKDGEPDDFYIKENLLRQTESCSEMPLFITQGFICRTSKGEISNLGRGGSDYSASIVAVAAEADEIQIWTDIDGMHNNDPRYVDNTQAIAYLSFDEAAELAYFGAKILHPLSIRPAKLADIPVRLKNTLTPDAEGTLISRRTDGKGIKAIAAKDEITVVKIKSDRMLMAYGFMRKVFEVFETYETPIDMVATSEVAVSISLDNTSHIDKIVRDLKQFGMVEVDSNLSIICIVGDFISGRGGIAAQIFQSLSNIPIRMISYGGSDHNVSVLVKQDDKKAALMALNTLFTDVQVNL
jgi:aspartate kinase